MRVGNAAQRGAVEREMGFEPTTTCLEEIGAWTLRFRAWPVGTKAIVMVPPTGIRSPLPEKGVSDPTRPPETPLRAWQSAEDIVALV